MAQRSCAAAVLGALMAFAYAAAARDAADGIDVAKVRTNEWNS